MCQVRDQYLYRMPSPGSDVSNGIKAVNQYIWLGINSDGGPTTSSCRCPSSVAVLQPAGGTCCEQMWHQRTLYFGCFSLSLPVISPVSNPSLPFSSSSGGVMDHQRPAALDETKPRRNYHQTVGTSFVLLHSLKFLTLKEEGYKPNFIFDIIHNFPQPQYATYCFFSIPGSAKLRQCLSLSTSASERA